MTPLTWKSLSTSDPVRDAAQTAAMFESARQGITGGFKSIGDVLTNVNQAPIDAQENALKADFQRLALMRGTPEEIQQRVATLQEQASALPVKRQADMLAALSTAQNAARTGLTQEQAFMEGQRKQQEAQAERAAKPIRDALLLGTMSDDPEVRAANRNAALLYGDAGMLPNAADLFKTFRTSEDALVSSDIDRQQKQLSLRQTQDAVAQSDELRKYEPMVATALSERDPDKSDTVLIQTLVDQMVKAGAKPATVAAMVNNLKTQLTVLNPTDLVGNDAVAKAKKAQARTEAETNLNLLEKAKGQFKGTVFELGFADEPEAQKTIQDLIKTKGLNPDEVNNLMEAIGEKTAGKRIPAKIIIDAIQRANTGVIFDSGVASNFKSAFDKLLSKETDYGPAATQYDKWLKARNKALATVTGYTQE